MILRPPAVPIEDLADLRGQFAGVATKGAAPIALESPAGPRSQVVPAALKQTAPSPAPAGPAVPAVQNPPAAAPLSKKAALAAMPEEERKWLTEFVAPIILPEEEKLFLELTEPYQREIFKPEFWARREVQGLPEPLGPGYRNRYEELRGLADTKYDGWRNDAGRMVLRYGEPADIKKVEGCDRIFRDLEIWTITPASARIGTAKYIFYRPTFNAPRKIWTVGTTRRRGFQPGSCRKKFSDLALDCSPLQPRRPVQRTGLPGRLRRLPRVERDHGAPGQPDGRRERESPAPPAAGDLDRRARPHEGAVRRHRDAGREGDRRRGPGLRPAGRAPGPRRRTSPPPPRERPAAAPQALQQGDQGAHREARREVQGVPRARRADHHADDEREVFLEIPDSYQKDKFIESFWRRRSIDSFRAPDRLPARLHAAHRDGPGAVQELEQRPGEDLHHQRPPRRRRPDRLPGRLRPAADLVLRAARVLEEQGLPDLLPAVWAWASTSSGCP